MRPAAEGGGNKKFVVTIKISFPLCDMEDILEEEEEENAAVDDVTAQGKSTEDVVAVSKDPPLQRQNSRDANSGGHKRHSKRSLGLRGDVVLSGGDLGGHDTCIPVAHPRRQKRLNR